jgi:hypothetical protein
MIRRYYVRSVIAYSLYSANDGKQRAYRIHEKPAAKVNPRKAIAKYVI